MFCQSSRAPSHVVVDVWWEEFMAIIVQCSYVWELSQVIFDLMAAPNLDELLTKDYRVRLYI